MSVRRALGLVAVLACGSPPARPSLLVNRTSKAERPDCEPTKDTELTRWLGKHLDPDIAGFVHCVGVLVGGRPGVFVDAYHTEETAPDTFETHRRRGIVTPDRDVLVPFSDDPAAIGELTYTRLLAFDANGDDTDEIVVLKEMGHLGGKRWMLTVLQLVGKKLVALPAMQVGYTDRDGSCIPQVSTQRGFIHINVLYLRPPTAECPAEGPHRYIVRGDRIVELP
jgi:hypothetical protein